MLRSVTSRLFVAGLLAVAATGCNERSLDGQLDRSFSIKKASGKVTRFEKGPLSVRLASEHDGTRISFSQPDVYESTWMNVDFDRFDSDLFSFDERQTGSGIAIRGERRRENYKQAVNETRKCVCPAEFERQVDGEKVTVDHSAKRIYRNSYWKTVDTEIQQLEGTYVLSNPDAQFVRTHYTIELLNRGAVTGRFTAQTDALRDGTTRGSCSIQAPGPKYSTHEGLLSNKEQRHVFSKVRENECRYL